MSQYVGTKKVLCAVFSKQQAVPSYVMKSIQWMISIKKINQNKIARIRPYVINKIRISAVWKLLFGATYALTHISEPWVAMYLLLWIVKNKLGNYSPVSNPITYPMKEPIHNIYASIHGKTNQLKNLEYFCSLFVSIYKDKDQRKNMTE